MTTKKQLETKAEIATDDSPGGWGVMVDGVPVLRDPVLACEALMKDDLIAVDTETTGLNAWRNDIALVQFYGQQTGTLAVLQVRDGELHPAMHALFEAGKKMVVHNGVGFDLMFLDQTGVNWRRTTWYDTLVAETLLASTGRRDVSKSLRESVRRRLGKEIDKNIEHGQWGAENLSMRQIEYAAQDVLPLPALYEAQMTKARDTKQDGAMEMEQNLMPLVAQMTINGLPCLPERVAEYREKQIARIASAEKRLYELFGPDINLRSTKQLQAALGKVGIEVDSTAKGTLIPISQFGGKAGAIADDLLLWKAGNQRIKMYSEDWCETHIDHGFIHPRFWQCSADTTRFTCSNPNLQQIPKDSRAELIGGMDGYQVVNADYSQIEVRIAGYIAKDEVLLELLTKGDVHTATASVVFQCSEKAVTPRQRKLAKAMTFLLLFGGGVKGFHDYVKMSGGEIEFDEAAGYVRQFFTTFAGIRVMKERAEMLSRKQGPVYIRLPNGARRILVGWKKKSTTILNTMVQGTAAVGIKHGILEVGRRGLDKYLCGQVHDELVAFVPDNEAKEYGKELVEAMEVGMREVVDTTIKVSVSMGREWQP